MIQKVTNFDSLKGSMVGILIAWYVAVNTNVESERISSVSSSIYNTAVVNAMARQGLVLADKKAMKVFLGTIHQHHYGLFLLMRQIEHLIGMPVLTTEEFFSIDVKDKLSGINGGNDNVLISGINIALFIIEANLQNKGDMYVMMAKGAFESALEYIPVFYHPLPRQKQNGFVALSFSHTGCFLSY